MIIDFERINYLTSHPMDDPKGQYTPYYVFGVTRGIIKEYLNIVLGGPKSNKLNYKDAYDTLKYNKIILDESDIRDSKINDILE